jgi:hypothetical protein
VQERSGQLALFALTTCILPLITPELMLVPTHLQLCGVTLSQARR